MELRGQLVLTFCGVPPALQPHSLHAHNPKRLLRPHPFQNKRESHANHLTTLTTEPSCPINHQPTTSRDRYELQEHFMQRSLAPLLAHVGSLASLPKGQAPVRRLTLLQVCALFYHMLHC